MAAREFELDVHHGKPAAIRCHQRELVFFEAKEQAVEDVTRFVSRDRIRRLPQSVAQILLPNRNDFRAVKLRQRWELFFRQAEDFEKALAASNGSRVLSVDVELNFT